MTTTRPQVASGETVGLAVQLAESLTRASWRLRRASMRELAPLGLTFAQSRVLRILERSDEPLRIGDLAARLEVVPRATTSMIDSLEAAGLVRRQPDPTDRRSVLVDLTPEGRALRQRLSALRKASAEALFGRLTEDQRQQLLAILTALNERDEDCCVRASEAAVVDPSPAAPLRPDAGER